MGGEEENLKTIFRQRMAEELGSREISRAKQKLIREHFTPGTPVILRPAFLVPALSVFVVGLLFYWYKPLPKETVEPVAYEAKTAHIQKQIGPVITYEEKGWSVSVSEISSEVGSPMVYQKSYQNQPITVIWVFPKVSTVGGANK